jgi:hypothetical protein
VRSHSVVRDLARLEQPDQERPGHVDEVGRLLRRELQADGKDGHAATSAELSGGADEDGVEGFGELGARAVGPDDLCPLVVRDRPERALDRIERAALGLVRDDRLTLCDCR